MARITARKLLTQEYGVQIDSNTRLMECDEVVNLLIEWSTDGVVPACCDEGCEVEPDGQCEHDCPSVLLKLGFI